MWLGPLEFVAKGFPWWIFLAAVVVAVLTGPVIQGWLIGSKHLQTEATPKSPIVAWEKAGSAARMKEVVAAWGEEGRRWAGWSLVADVAFLAAYGVLFTLSFSMAAVYFREAHAPVGKLLFGFLAWAGLLPSLFDLTEDWYLRKTLRPFEGEELPGRMHRVSSIKWLSIYVLTVPSVTALLIFLIGCGARCQA
jgi:hypothetical protein